MQKKEKNMERIYKGNFGEIEKLIDENEIQGHPYENLYNYIGNKSNFYKNPLK